MKTVVISRHRKIRRQSIGKITKVSSLDPPTPLDQYAFHLGGSMGDILKLNVGDMAPPFILSNHLGYPVALSDLLRKSKVILTFFQGGWCPHCIRQLNEFQHSLGRIKAHQAKLVAVSPQTPDASLAMAEKEKLRLEILSDVGNEVARKFTTVFRCHDRSNGRRPFGIDFYRYYGDDSREIPVPAVFVIQQNGHITFARSEGGDFRARVDLDMLLEEL